MISTYILITKVALLISVSIVGWILGKKAKTNPKDISTILVYIISPVVIFSSILQSPSGIGDMKYSFGAFLTASAMALLAYLFSNLIWKNSKRNLFAFSGGTGNTGYFALPIVLSLFAPAQWAVAIFIIIGVNIYEFSVGYFITAKGVFNTKECIKKVLSLPIIYAAMAGILFKYIDISISDSVLVFMDNFKGAYSVLGMMVIGMSLSQFSKAEFDWTFLTYSLVWKHLIVPFVGVLTFHYIGVSSDVLIIIALMLLTPMAGNVVVVANQLNVHPEVAASTVMTSTFLSILSIPLSFSLIEYIS